MTEPNAELLEALCRAVYRLILGDEPDDVDRLTIAYVARYGLATETVEDDGSQPLDPSDPNAPAP